MEANKEFLAIACGELGYLEKSRKSWDLYGINCLFDKTKYAGADNVQKYAYETGHYTKYGWAAWCQSFVNWCMMAAFGADKANALLCGKYGSASTMEVKDAMVSAGRKVDFSKAQPGDIVFRQRSGGGHVGIVKGWKDGKLVTVEGNSSSTDITSWNGGAVVEHVGASWSWCCRPDWSIVQHPKEDEWKWLYSGGYWYYQNQDGKNVHDWALIQETGGTVKHWYYFNQKGQMQKGLLKVNDKIYYLSESGDLEGACCVTDETGALVIWNI